MEWSRAGRRKLTEMGTGPTPPHLARGPKIYAIPALSGYCWFVGGARKRAAGEVARSGRAI